LQVLYYNQSNFRNALLRLRQSGGRKTAAAMRLLNLIQQAGAGIDSFASLPSTTDRRIENAVIYVLNDEAHLVAVKSNSTIHLCFCGTLPEVQSWLQANRGLTLTVDENLNIDPTVVTTDSANAALAPTQITEDNKSFLCRVKGLDLESLVPSSMVRRYLLELDENSTEDRIREVLDAIADEDVRLFLHDVISRAKAGDISGAEARIRLRKGEACPVIDAQGLTQQAITSEANPDQVTNLTDLDLKELERLFDQDFEKWMLHLHKDQETLAKSDYDKPVVLTGVSGSGKTCILVHRARHLARTHPGERIGILTLNRSLARLIRNLVDRLCLHGEAKNIHVMAFYDYFSHLLHDFGPSEYLNHLSEQAPGSSAMHKVVDTVNVRRLAREFDPLSGETTEDTWEDFYASQNSEVKEWLAEICRYLEEYRIDASRYLREEFTLVRSAFPISDRLKGYTTFERTGRSIAFQPKHRSDILRLLLLFEEYMLAGEVLDVLELTLAVTPLWRQIRDLPPSKRFRCLLVDEFQDLSTLDLRLLLWVPPRDAKNALFLTGDPVQKILVKRLNLRDAGLGEGSAIYRHIAQNYRNSRQILIAATKLANIYGELARKSGEELEVLNPDLAVRETNKPIALKTTRQVKKAWEIARQCLAEGQTQAWTICIATAAPHKHSPLELLSTRPPGLQAEILSGDYIKRPNVIVVSTLNDIKGFEFNLVIIAGCDDGLCPPGDAPEGEVWRDALRLYVCMTRARDQVYLLYEASPSQFLRHMGDTLVWTDEALKQDYEPAPSSPEPAMKPRKQLTEILARKGLMPHESCIEHLSQESLDMVRLYYNSKVDRSKWIDCRGYTAEGREDLERQKNRDFNRWLTPKNLGHLRVRHFAPWRHIGRKTFQRLDQELRALGITTFMQKK